MAGGRRPPRAAWPRGAYRRGGREDTYIAGRRAEGRGRWAGAEGRPRLRSPGPLSAFPCSFLCRAFFCLCLARVLSRSLSRVFFLLPFLPFLCFFLPLLPLLLYLFISLSVSTSHPAYLFPVLPSSTYFSLSSIPSLSPSLSPSFPTFLSYSHPPFFLHYRPIRLTLTLHFPSSLFLYLASRSPRTRRQKIQEERRGGRARREK